VLRARRLIKDWLPILLWMGLIFCASSDQQSFLHSVKIVEPILRWLWPGVSNAQVHLCVVGARKLAHLTEYAVLALLVWRALCRPGLDGKRAWRWRTAGVTSLLILLFAASDEFHQHFVPSRDASVRDVAIDTAGGILALLLVWVLGRWRKRW
jgi:VanZ family protein